MFSRVQIIETIKQLIHQFTKFGAVGVLNTALFYGLYLVFLTMLSPKVGYYAAYVLSMAFAVLTNLRFTFQKRATLRKIALFVCVYLFSMVIGGQILDLLIGYSIGPRLAGFLTLFVTVATNFLGLKAAAKWA